MSIQDYLKELNINKEADISEDGSYIVTILNSNDYGKIFSKLEKSDDLDIMEDNQVVTEQGSSLMYESISQPYLLNLIADFEGDTYELIITEIKVGD